MIRSAIRSASGQVAGLNSQSGQNGYDAIVVTIAITIVIIIITIIIIVTIIIIIILK